MHTIVALSTPIGRGAIAVVRLSGEQSQAIARAVFHPFPKAANVLSVGTIATDSFDEQAMCVYFSAPRSFTGEDMVEFHCHGGTAVASAVIEKCISLGARLAQNGEFSKRAFLNGKLNLDSAEGIIEMIDAESAAAAKAGSNLLHNKLGQRTVALQNRLTDIISQTEVALDYPEEDLELLTQAEIGALTAELLADVTALLSTVATGKIVKYGIDIAIVGKPNVGKSSLLNALLGAERAIVSDVPGTTRDTVSESIIYRDIKLNFVDTAGIRHSTDVVEAEGVKRTLSAIDGADLVLQIVDNFDDELLKTAKPIIKIYNKCDLYTEKPPLIHNELCISAKLGINIQELLEYIYRQFIGGEVNMSELVLTNERHIDCLTRVQNCLQEALRALAADTLDCVSLNLREAWETLGEITGATASEDIVDRIFQRFCLGK
jgi:tRNA modification GTPase